MKRLLAYCFAALLAVVMPTQVRAVCDQSFSSMADQDLWATHGCWRDYYLWHYQALDMRYGDWRDRGWSDACNLNMEFTKHWNAGYLVQYGLLDNNDQSFHGTVDYSLTTEARASDFHSRLYHNATDRTDIFGLYEHHSSGPNEVSLACPRFDSDPAARAADWMHEGWHAWNDKHGWNGGSAGGHQPCTMEADGSCRNGNCSVNGCDYFYFHGIAQYLFGAMWQDDGTGNRFHSPNQVQVEFQCDVADQPQPWVPASVRDGARIETNARSAERFINGPGYYCGDSRPW